MTRHLLIRTGLILAAVFLAGCVLTFTFGSPYLRSAGLSLILPGGGFLYDAWPPLVLATFISLVFAVVMWWGLSAFFLVPLVWALSVLGSVALARGHRLFVPRGTTWGWAIPVVLVGYVLLLCTVGYRSERTYRAKRAKVEDINDYLRTAAPPTPSKPVLEPNDMDAELLRWVYDLGLQPPDHFEGFDWGEQYHGGTCVRYQLVFLGEGLAAYCVNALPNYTEVAERVMGALIDKMTDLRVWKYWALENFLARFSRNPDPMIKDNIMLSGFFQSQINMFEAATGSTRFDEPGCLPFVWKDGRVYSYDHASINDTLVRNFEQSAFGMFPCEPTWVFAVCNVMGAQGVTGYDRLHKTSTWDRVGPGWRRGLLEEFMTPDGAFRHIRTNAFGFSFKDGDGTGEYRLTASHQFEDVAPDLHLRGTLLSVRELPPRMLKLASLVKDGELDLPVAPKRERSTYIMSALSEWTGIVGGARLVGDEELAQAAQRRMERDCATGKRFPERPLTAGVQSIAAHMLVRWATPLSLGQIALRGYEPPIGPVLEHAPWPELLVTRARSDDGKSLDLVIEPNRPANGNDHELAFSALAPGRSYRLTGAGVDVTVTADSSGRGSTVVHINARTPLHLEPQPVSAGS